MRIERELNALLIPSASTLGVVTEKPISVDLGTTGQGCRALRVDFKTTDVAVTGSITVKLQQRSAGNPTWTDVKSVSVTTNAEYSIKMLDLVAADQPFMPLQPHVRLVVTTTNALDAVTFAQLFICQGIN